jgi:hypothetical protein
VQPQHHQPVGAEPAFAQGAQPAVGGRATAAAFGCVELDQGGSARPTYSSASAGLGVDTRGGECGQSCCCYAGNHDIKYACPGRLDSAARLVSYYGSLRTRRARRKSSTTGRQGREGREGIMNMNFKSAKNCAKDGIRGTHRALIFSKTAPAASLGVVLSFLLPPPRRFAPPLLGQEGIFHYCSLRVLGVLCDPSYWRLLCVLGVLGDPS